MKYLFIGGDKDGQHLECESYVMEYPVYEKLTSVDYKADNKTQAKETTYRRETYKRVALGWNGTIQIFVYKLLDIPDEQLLWRLVSGYKKA